ncbi:hypothetical protein [Fusobacterium sp.]|uniref:hypothetical protein n=1 Tax=Fusobacterium sp. TaxID=68766 RepID=UPI002627A744|nr:hypothetical protein [Fusobacterium sp.]
MKKLLLIFAILSVFSFAKGPQDIIEDRIENQLRVDLSNVIDYKVDYDVDIYSDRVNVEIEIDSFKEPTLNYSKIIDSVLKAIKNNIPEAKDINLVVKQDKDIGEDKILFNKNI